MSKLLTGTAALVMVLAPAMACARHEPQNGMNLTGKVEAMADTRDLLHIWLDVLPEGDFDAFPGKVSPDLVLRLPFVPAGIPNEIQGREKIRARLVETAKGRSRLVLSDIKILGTEDPELFVTTARGEATMANGNIYRNSYVIFTRIRDGEILEHTEYLNPLAILQAAGQ